MGEIRYPIFKILERSFRKTKARIPSFSLTILIQIAPSRKTTDIMSYSTNSHLLLIVSSYRRFPYFLQNFRKCLFALWQLFGYILIIRFTMPNATNDVADTGSAFNRGITYVNGFRGIGLS